MGPFGAQVTREQAEEWARALNGGDTRRELEEARAARDAAFAMSEEMAEQNVRLAEENLRIQREAARRVEKMGDDLAYARAQRSHVEAELSNLQRRYEFQQSETRRERERGDRYADEYRRLLHAKVSTNAA